MPSICNKFESSPISPQQKIKSLTLTAPTSSLNNVNSSFFVNSSLTLTNQNAANAIANNTFLSPLREFVSKPENSATLVAPCPVMPSFINNKSTIVSAPSFASILKNEYNSSLSSPIPFFSSSLSTPRETTLISSVKPIYKENYNSLMQSVIQSVNNPAINVSNHFLNYLNDKNKSPLLQTFMSNPSGFNSVFKSATLPSNNGREINSVQPFTGLISNLNSINNVLMNGNNQKTISSVLGLAHPSIVTQPYLITSPVVDSTTNPKSSELPDSTTSEKKNVSVSPSTISNSSVASNLFTPVSSSLFFSAPMHSNNSLFINNNNNNNNNTNNTFVTFPSNFALQNNGFDNNSKSE